MLPPSSNMLISILFETILGHTTKRQLIYAAFFEVCDVYKHTHTNLATFNVPSFFVPRVATQCLFLVLFPFLPVPLYVALLVALRSSEVQFPTTTTKRTNTHTQTLCCKLLLGRDRGPIIQVPENRRTGPANPRQDGHRTRQNRTEQNRTWQDRQIRTKQKSSRKRIRNKSGNASVQHIKVAVQDRNVFS